MNDEQTHSALQLLKARLPGNVALIVLFQLFHCVELEIPRMKEEHALQ